MRLTNGNSFACGPRPFSDLGACLQTRLGGGCGKCPVTLCRVCARCKFGIRARAQGRLHAKGRISVVPPPNARVRLEKLCPLKTWELSSRICDSTTHGLSGLDAYAQSSCGLRQSQQRPHMLGVESSPTIRLRPFCSRISTRGSFGLSSVPGTCTSRNGTGVLSLSRFLHAKKRKCVNRVRGKTRPTLSATRLLPDQLSPLPPCPPCTLRHAATLLRFANLSQDGVR
jgi:hypothetical protein